NPMSCPGADPYAGTAFNECDLTETLSVFYVEPVKNNIRAKISTDKAYYELGGTDPVVRVEAEQKDPDFSGEVNWTVIGYPISNESARVLEPQTFTGPAGSSQTYTIPIGDFARGTYEFKVVMTTDPGDRIQYDNTATTRITVTNEVVQTPELPLIFVILVAFAVLFVIKKE
ncbi:MAG: hypothetical protein NUV67_04320, partial [archaeon]|nr:hypothetical protein [archaeon]